MKKAYVIGGVIVVVVIAIIGAVLFLPSYFAKRGIDDLVASLPDGTSLTYRQVDYSLFKRELVLTGGVIHVADPAFDVDVAEIRIQDGNADLQNAVDKARAAPDPTSDTATKVAGKIFIKGVHGSYAMMGAKIMLDGTTDQIEIDNARLYLGELFAPLPPLKPEGDNSMFSGLSSVPEMQDFVSQIRDLVQHSARTNLAIAYDSSKIQNFQMQIKVPSANQSGSFHIGIAQSDGFDRGKVAAGSLQDINMQVATVSMGIADWKVDARDMRDSELSLRDGETMETAFDHISSPNSQSIDNIVVKNNGVTLFTIEQIALSLTSYQGGIPSFDMTLAKLTLDNTAQGNPAVATMTSLGYSPAVFDVNFSDKWDATTKQLTISNTNLTLENGGTLGFQGVFSDLQHGIPPVGTLPTTKLVGMTLRYNDNSLATRLLTQLATRGGMDVETYKRTSISILQRQQQALASANPAVAATIPALEAFITNPHQLTMTINPPTPFGFADFDRANQQATINKLGLLVTAQ